jgi:hypothetical protein
MSYAEILCGDFPFATGCTHPKTRGTLVYIGSNVGPVYEIVSIEGPTAWVRRPVTHADEALVPLRNLRVANRPAAQAA